MSPASIATAAHKRLVWKAKGLGNKKKKGPVLEVWTNPRKSEWKDPLSGSRGLNFAGVSNHPAFLSEKIRIFFFFVYSTANAGGEERADVWIRQSSGRENLPPTTRPNC